ncbi:uncharacterized protein LOC133800703 [Humulus lupulus]|uniref:uncharacterized protein LOC133800703 n=1 Tax=Humulus lupulus TaxID=3486 RepID=UPI002B40A4E1|nr:uncharacterized protein LOC133800703 [Humulus lupulus]
MGDLRDWSPELNGAALEDMPSSSSSLSSSPPPPPLLQPPPLSLNQTVIGSEYWQRAEEATQGIIGQVQPTVVSEKRRRAVIDYVQRLIRGFLGCEVFPFGSVPLKTYLPDGDIDLTAFGGLNVEEALANDVCSVLEREEKNSAAEFVVKDVQLIRAEVKLVKCLVQNIVVDISFNQLGGLCTLCFLEQVDCLISKDHLFKRSIILIKAWCYYESRILGAHHGLISTYALETLVLYIFHLFNSSLNGPLAVLYKFLDYFSNFDWDNYCISLNGPVRISSLPELMSETPENAGHDLLLTDDFLKGCVEMFSAPSRGYETSSRTFPQKHLNIVDPLKENNNLGRSVSKGNFFRIRSAFTYGARKLGRILSQPEENIGDEIRKFFSNTLERHGKGQRPDVQDSFHMSGHDEFSAASFSDAELQEIQRGYEAESSSMTGEYRLNHERSLLPGGDPDVEISGTEVMTERYVGEQYENSSNVMPSMDLSKPENSSDGTAVSDNSLHGDAQDLAMSRFQSLTISNDSPKSSPTRHAPHLYFLHSPIANEETNGNCQVRQQKNSGSTENTAGDQDEHQFVSNHKIMSPVGSKQHLSRLSSIVLSSEDFYPSSSSYRLSTAIAGSPEPFNTLSDLNGDFESHLNSLHYGRWCYDCALNASIPPMASMVSQFHGKKSWDVIRRSLHLKHNVFSQMNTNGVVHRPAFYPINSPLLPGGVGFGVEEMQKPRGTGTYFPNMNHYRDRPMTPRGRNQVPVRSPRNNNRMVTVGTESGLLERSGRDTAQAQISTHKVNGKSVSADDLSGSPRRKVNTNNANGSMHPSERFVEFGSMGHPPPEAPLPRGSWQTNSGLSPVQNSDTSLNSPASDKLKPVLSMDKDRIAVKSYHLKDDDDFPPLSV